PVGCASAVKIFLPPFFCLPFCPFLFGCSLCRAVPCLKAVPRLFRSAFLCIPLYCYLSKSFNFARICNIFSSCQLCELIDIRLACCQECGKDAASPVGELVTMCAGDLSQETVTAQQGEFAGDFRRTLSLFLLRGLARIEQPSK